MANYSPVDFELGEMVVHQNILYTLQSVHCSELGYRKYTIKPMGKGRCLTVPKYQLSKPLVQDLLMANINWDEPVLEQDVSCSTDNTDVVPPDSAVLYPDRQGITPDNTVIPLDTSVVSTESSVVAENSGVMPPNSDLQTMNTGVIALDIGVLNSSDCTQQDSGRVVPSTSDAEKNCSLSHHALLDEEEIDQIAKNRLSVNREKQTKWAVTLFKGKI